MYAIVFTPLSVKAEQLDIIQPVEVDSRLAICQLDLTGDVKYAP